MSRFITSVLVGIFLFGCKDRPQLPYYNSPTFTPIWEEDTNFSKDTLHTISNFCFTDQDGKKITKADVANKIYIANFMFTACPGICPKMTTNLIKVQEVFGSTEDVLILSHTVMPWADSVSQLKSFADAHSLNTKQWKLLTGKKSELYDIARTSYFAEEVAGFTRDSTEFLHTEHCLLIDRDGHIRGVYNGTLPLEIDRMIEDIHILKGS